MKCNIHLDRDAIGTCSRCGKFICSECAVEIKGKNLCKKCLDYAFDENKGDKEEKPMVFMNAGGGGASSSSSSSASAAAAAGGRGIPTYPINSVGVHIVLFLFTAGIGNIIYYVSVKSRQKRWRITYGR